MKRKGSKRRAAEPPVAGSEGRRADPALAASTGQSSLPPQYKVVELSTVDEISLENALNEWAQRGWRFDGIQFAMRDSSKRPAMAFLLFTRLGAAASNAIKSLQDRPILRPLPDLQHPTSDPWHRLRQLAGEAGDEEPGEPTPE
jgi:hypothetical protein